jgi:hypothetical protein
VKRENHGFRKKASGDEFLPIGFSILLLKRQNGDSVERNPFELRLKVKLLEKANGAVNFSKVVETR